MRRDVPAIGKAPRGKGPRTKRQRRIRDGTAAAEAERARRERQRLLTAQRDTSREFDRWFM